MSERPIIDRFRDRLQAGYRANRLPALEGTTPASDGFFAIWRQDGLFDAIRYLVDVQ